MRYILRFSSVTPITHLCRCQGLSPPDRRHGTLLTWDSFHSGCFVLAIHREEEFDATNFKAFLEPLPPKMLQMCELGM